MLQSTIIPKYFYLFFIAAALFFVWGCDKALSDPNPTGSTGGTKVDTVYFTVEGIKFSNGAISDIGHAKAKIKGDFSDVANTTQPIQQHGFIWAKAIDRLTLTKCDSFSELGPRTSPGVFSTEMTNLSANTAYFSTGYVVSNGNIAYHPKPLSFTTLKGKAPVIAKGVASGIVHNAAKIENVITDFIGTDVMAHGHVWGDNANVDLSNCGGNKTTYGAVPEVDDHTFSSSIQGLEANKIYFFKAYATNQYGTDYSPAAEFKTLPLPTPNITIQAVSIIEPNGTGNVNPGEAVTLKITLKNTGNADANDVKLSVGTGAHYVISSSLPVSYNTILPDGQKEGEVFVKINTDVPWGTIVTVPMTITESSGRNWPFPNSASFTVVSPYVVDNGLSAYFRFSECNGASVSSVLGGVTGDLFGPTFSNDVIPGTSGCCLNFSSQSKQYVQVGTNPLFGFSAISTSFWLKTLSGNAHIFCAVSGNYNLKILDGKFYSENLGLQMDYPLTNFLEGQWHHFVLVQNDNGNAKLYVDGVFKFERKSISFPSNNGTGWYIGRNYSQYDTYFDGKIDNLRVYNRALSQSEVTKIFDAKQ